MVVSSSRMVLDDKRLPFDHLPQPDHPTDTGHRQHLIHTMHISPSGRDFDIPTHISLAALILTFCSKIS
jgi:hypothetical protein